MFNTLLALHIAGGSAALASMWIPLIAKKGGTTHRRAGWLFVGGMALVSLTAVGLAAWRLMYDPRPQARDFAIFLLFIALLSGNAVSSGVRAIRTKRRTGSHRHPWDVGLAALLAISSVFIALFGLRTGQVLFAAFSVIGLVNGVMGVRYWLTPPSTPMHWWLAHMNGMLGGCIAALTAFMVVNAQSMGLWPLAAWLGPSVVLGPVTAIWTNYYRQKWRRLPQPRALGTRLEAQ